MGWDPLNQGSNEISQTHDQSKDIEEHCLPTLENRNWNFWAQEKVSLSFSWVIEHGWYGDPTIWGTHWLDYMLIIGIESCLMDAFNRVEWGMPRLAKLQCCQGSLTR